MDAYLESLVKKEIINDSQEIATEVVESTDKPTVIEESTVIEEVNIADSSDEVINELNSISDENEVKYAEEEFIQPVTNSTIEPGQIVFVNKIRVYKTPDVKQIAKIISGNVTYLGRIGDFNIISYMKHGFGVVKGYTIDDLL